MENQLTTLALNIAKAYRPYDEYPEIGVDLDVYFGQGRKFFETLAREYVLVSIPDKEQRAKALLRGMLMFVQQWVSSNDHVNSEVIDLHFNSAADEWLAMDEIIIESLHG